MLTAAGPAGTSETGRTRIYLLQTFHLRHGTQLARIHEYLSNWALPTLRKLHSGPQIALEALLAPHMPQVALILGFESMEQMWKLRGQLNEDEELQRAFEAWQEGPEPPFERQHNTLLEATAYSPEIVVPETPPEKPRIFELRVYHSPTWRQLRALHERFAGPEVQIFARVGVYPVFYSATIFGANMPNLTYLTPFDDLAAREKAWSAFAADPEWVKARKESIDKHGQIVSVLEISLYRATPYSPVR